jgi:hypothetical protein
MDRTPEFFGGMEDIEKTPEGCHAPHDSLPGWSLF